MAQAQEPFTITIGVNASPRDLIDQASERLGCNRADVILDFACRHAEDEMLDQTYLALDMQGFAAFELMVDNPPAATDRLRQTFMAKTPWNAMDVSMGQGRK